MGKKTKAGAGVVLGIVIGGLLVSGLFYTVVVPGAKSTVTSVTSHTVTVTSNLSPSVTTTTVPTTVTSTVTATLSTSTQASSSSSVTLPASAPVTVDSKTTAVLVLDYAFCYRTVGCNATLSAIQGMLTSARSSGVPVIYTRTPIPKEIANQSSDTVITNDVGPDKFLNTSLASILQQKGIKTLVVVGIAANGALLYTAQEGCVRHFTVVVPADTIVGTPYVQTYVPYQLLNGPGCANANNTPLSPNHATISTTASIAFR